MASDIDEVLAEELNSDSENSDIEIVEVQNPESGEDESANYPHKSSADAANGTIQTGIKSLRCPICLETPEIVAVAACGHPYCHECIFTALSSSRNATMKTGECSLCRKRVRYDQVIYMELKKGCPIDEEESGKEADKESIGRQSDKKGSNKKSKDNSGKAKTAA